MNEALHLSERLVQQFAGHNIVWLWTRRLVLLTSTLSDSDAILTPVNAAIEACIASKVL